MSRSNQSLQRRNKDLTWLRNLDANIEAWHNKIRPPLHYAPQVTELTHLNSIIHSFGDKRRQPHWGNFGRCGCKESESQSKKENGTNGALGRLWEAVSWVGQPNEEHYWETNWQTRLGRAVQWKSPACRKFTVVNVKIMFAGQGKVRCSVRCTSRLRRFSARWRHGALSPFAAPFVQQGQLAEKQRNSLLQC